MARNLQVETDEELALKLQRQFDEEAEQFDRQENQDYRLALQTAACRELSDESDAAENPVMTDMSSKNQSRTRSSKKEHSVQHLLECDRLQDKVVLSHDLPKKSSNTSRIGVSTKRHGKVYSGMNNRREDKIEELFGSDSDDGALCVEAASTKPSAKQSCTHETLDWDKQSSKSCHDISESDSESDTARPSACAPRQKVKAVKQAGSPAKAGKQTSTHLRPSQSDLFGTDSEPEYCEERDSEWPQKSLSSASTSLLTGEKPLRPKLEPNTCETPLEDAVHLASESDKQQKRKVNLIDEDTSSGSDSTVDLDPVADMKKRSSKQMPPSAKKRRTENPEPGCSGATSRGAESTTSVKDPLYQAHPFSFFLTKVSGIAKQYNSHLALNIKDILSTSMGNLQKSAQFNYMFDIPWLVSQYPTAFRTKPMLIVHGFQRAQKGALDMEASAYDNIRLCQARLDIPYGTHHTKMMLLMYDAGLRVVIHTSNLIEQDWHQKSQGIWMSPLCARMAEASGTDGDSATYFKRDMLEYLAAYRARQLEEWMTIIKEHDMSGCRVHLIGSVPGRHTGTKKPLFGHLKLRKVLQAGCPELSGAQAWPVLGQFSSVGSLGPTKESWLCGEWLTSLSACRAPTALPKLHLVYPSKDNVRQSLEGYPAGGSLPYSVNVAMKQKYMHEFWHQWKSEVRGRSEACPHIKTYLRASPDWSQLAWFIVTSANLSKAAWGALEKNSSQLMIRSYELGVLFLPSDFGPKPTLHVMTKATHKDQLVFPVPYDLPPTAYGKSDRPWVWDIPYMDKPDTHGNMWCPS